jgi:hypothetical protein
MSADWIAFGHGALTMAAAVAGLSFLKLWRVSGDRLFLFLCGAFWALGLNWMALALARPADESRHFVYLLRLVAFLAILVGILDKNRRRPAGR